MRLNYKAVNQKGKIVNGILDAKDKTEAANYLRSHNFTPVEIKIKENILRKYLFFLNKVNSTQIVFFTRQLSSMISSGLTLIQALLILKQQTHNEVMFEMLTSICADVQDGKSFSTAIAKYPNVFSPIYISLIKAAEESGLLDKVLERLADNLEKDQKLKGTIKSALMYPIIVIIGMIAVMTVMMIFVIPQLTVLYRDLNIELPLPTLIVVSISNFMVTFWPLILGGTSLAFVIFMNWKKSIKGKMIIDDLKLKIPVFGKLIKQMILAECSRTLGLLIGNGTLIVEALKETSEVAGNVYYENSVIDVSKKVEKGMSVGDAMVGDMLFPPILVEMVRIGEQTGKLDESLLKVSEYFEREVDQTVKALTTALEPFIMIVLGLGVAFLIVSIITPIYNITSSIQ